jgi:transketolase
VRGAFVKALTELAERDSRVLLLTADLGYMALEPFSEGFPDRFFNVGVAEQNMVGLAAGLAEAGFIPFVYSIVGFASLRPYEFIRNGPILQALPVRIVGVGGGFEYGHNGPSHYGLEDVGVMRVQPGISVIAPADHEQARSAFLATWDLPGPVYYRIGKDDKTTVPGLDGRFEIGRLQIVREGADLLIVAMGSVAVEAVAAAEALAREGVACTVAIVASLNPAPTLDLAEMLGGIGSLVSEVAAQEGLGCRVVRCGVRAAPHGLTGSQGYMHTVNGISSDKLVQTALQSLRGAST